MCTKLSYSSNYFVSDFDDAVDEEDLDLIEENLGINLDRVSRTSCLKIPSYKSFLLFCVGGLTHSLVYFEQKRYKRLKKLKPIDSDEEDDDRASVGGHSADEREALAHELFEDDDMEQPPVCLMIC